MVKKILTKDIKLKSGVVLPKGLQVGVTPYKNGTVPTVLALVTLPDGDSKILRYQSIYTPPSVKTLEKWEEMGYSKTPLGKKTEPDGTDEDDFPSWLLILGYI